MVSVPFTPQNPHKPPYIVPPFYPGGPEYPSYPYYPHHPPPEIVIVEKPPPYQIVIVERPPPPEIVIVEKPPPQEIVIEEKPIDFVTTIEIVEVCPSYDPYQSEYNIKVTENFRPNATIVSELKVAPDVPNIHVNDSNRGGLCSDEEHATFDEIGNVGRGGYADPVRPCKIVSGWTCPKFGYYKHPTHCQKYVHCKFCGENSVYRCGHDDCYDGKRCSSDWSTCGELERCTRHGQLLHDPWDRHGYFICWQRKGFPKKHRVYRRECYNKYIFNVQKQKCIRPKWKKKH